MAKSFVDYDKVFASANLVSPLEKLYGWIDLTCNDFYQAKFEKSEPRYIFHEEDVPHTVFVELLGRIFNKDFFSDLDSEGAKVLSVNDDFFCAETNSQELLTIYTFDNEIHHTLAIMNGDD